MGKETDVQFEYSTDLITFFLKNLGDARKELNHRVYATAVAGHIVISRCSDPIRTQTYCAVIVVRW